MGEILPYVRSMTRRSIGQIWFHHTGHDESRSYGTKAREWQMDIVALMERVDLPGADLAFTLKFTKARETDARENSRLRSGRDVDQRRGVQLTTATAEEGAWDQSARHVRHLGGRNASGPRSRGVE